MRRLRTSAAAAALGVAAVLPLATAVQPAAAAEAKLDNPYAGAKVYVNPDWSAKAAAEPGGSAVANQPTFVWMDRIAAISGSSAAKGLRAHLDTALAQGANLVQIVIYDLPGRDCSALASNGELGATEIGRYKTEYIDPIAAIMSDSKYAGLRIVNVIEPDSLPNLVTNAGGTAGSTDACATMKANGNYEAGVGYALHTLGAIPNVYNYLDAAHHGWLGWDSNMGPAATEFKKAATTGGATVNDVAGFIVNTANYSALTEPYFKVTDSVNGTTVRQSKWVDWNYYVDELSFAQALRTKLVGEGFNSSIGMLIDTSRNGWGGAARPAGPGPLTSVDDYVNGSRVDRRIHAGNWCNQSGAGLGERPTTAPATGIDAYVWAKPPGESDGASQAIANDEGKGFDRMCDPTYTGNGRNGNSMSGALPNSPLAGAWFSAQFQQLLANAYPPVTGGTTDTQAPTAPSGLTSPAKTSGSVTLSWTASTDNVGVTGYDVYRGGALVGSSATTSFTDTGLAASTAYSYTVKAKDAAGNVSAASATLSVTTSAGGTADTQAPTAPSGLTSPAKTSGSVTLSWTASTDNVGVTGYDVYRGGALVGSSATTSFTDTGLAASTAYSYTVKAKDAAGNVSAASAALSVTTSAGGTGSGCTATYKVSSDWGAGFNADVTVTNNGTTAINGWKVTWTFGGQQKISNLWNGSYTQSGQAVTVTNAAYNGAIGAGGSAGFGFGATNSGGSNAVPTLTCTAL
ncbi:glycoside hydrolase family 6 protein [Kitasatospora sp. DSM 101779]|uniref:glycoside hydrolase family 6 protein n=1 Tax=Kitasatospora sp. DSM 101779 TaxID=2853165 RepID=UPI0021D851CE|nr:glycoside hydrolase family 6 protein [Kitasatospora sp. DSM 101779]MCU7821729.1 glycoside hydrolase family 6 protein [Kitasatospora sp. DSM 101779]